MNGGNTGYCIENYTFGSGVYTHVPVLPREVLGIFDFGQADVKLVDGTLGCGGHASLLLERNPNARLLGIDRDASALERAAASLAFASDRVTLVRGEFGNLDEIAAANGFAEADGVLLDVGVSSPQIDDPARGFSWRQDGALDMRMNPGCGVTAAELLNGAEERELADIFFRYGELRQARKLAAAVAARRKVEPFRTTCQFAAFCEEVLGRSPRGKLPTPTLAFQALRIAVNDELGELERGLAAAVKTLRAGGRLAVISFHSLEDRIAKEFIREGARSCVCPPTFPVCVCGKVKTLEPLTRKAVTAAADELAANRRSAPAKLRAAEKL